MEILIDNQEDILGLELTTIENLCLEVMKYQKCDVKSELSLVFCNDDFIQKVNKDYRQKDEPTDVLSFPIETENFNPEIKPIGDIIISIETAIRQAEEMKHSLEQEIIILLIHGLLHLNGMTHDNDSNKQKMKESENSIYEHLKKQELFSSLFTQEIASLISRAEEA